jgi:hypothetical protein
MDENHAKGETFILHIHFDTATGTVKRRARIDTGAPNEFISYNTVVRLGAEKDIEPLDTDDHWFGVQGESFRARGKLHRSWSCKNSIRTWDTEFFVIDTELFDVLLGRSFCELSGVVSVDRSLLPLHRNRKGAGMLHLLLSIRIHAHTTWPRCGGKCKESLRGQEARAGKR